MAATKKNVPPPSLGSLKPKARELFNEFDMNGNGALSLAEIDLALVSRFPHLGPHKPAIMRAYRDAEQDGNGLITFDEFETLLELIDYYDQIYEQFDAMDVDHDHHITFDEFTASRTKAGRVKPKDMQQLRAEFDQIDSNGGGKILFTEFCAYMAKQKMEATRV
ncbi:hypothetical protein CXG81DRAFT_28841 [Caulochytrium protostelioides]|nr:hypothetical protein CXG81DRAFT_28841 [Caulochytrium protostelioides]|eukprot:RKO98311.1 hypothetical protein CXG81DRAFT_28841 [Caulochytrium protostelioides]